MTSSPSKRHQAGRRRFGAFTLVEVLIASSLSAFILAGVFSAYLMLVRSGVRMSDYSIMESEVRRGFERMGVDARMANGFVSTFSGGAITSFTLTIPSQDLSTQSQVTYGFDTTDPTNQKFFVVPGSDPTSTTGRINLVNKVTGLTFNRYDTTDTLIPASTTSDAGIKHIQVSINVSRAGVSSADSSITAATQVIRSSAFTIRNISI
jgi:Tfp pilus assembly protein PilW